MADTNTGAAASAVSTPEQSADKVIATIPESKIVTNTKVTESTEGEAIDTEVATEEELAELAASDEATTAEKQEAKAELKRRMKFKVNGREVEREVDLNDEEALQALLQKGFAADERFQSASTLEKKMKEFAALMQSDPMQALIAAGHDPDKLTEAYMEKRLQELSKSPEQQQLEKLQKEIEKERKLRESLENEKLSAEQAQVEVEFSRQLDEEITTALGKSDLPKSPYVVKRIAENLMLGLEQDENISVEDVLPIVERQIKEEIQQMFEAMPEDVIEKVLGNNVANKLRKRRLNSMKKAPEGASAVKPTGQSEMNKSKPKQDEAKPVKAKDFFKNF
jgi:hypothetical protein